MESSLKYLTRYHVGDVGWRKCVKLGCTLGTSWPFTWLGRFIRSSFLGGLRYSETFLVRFHFGMVNGIVTSKYQDIIRSTLFNIIEHHTTSFNIIQPRKIFGSYTVKWLGQADCRPPNLQSSNEEMWRISAVNGEVSCDLL